MKAQEIKKIVENMKATPEIKATILKEALKGNPNVLFSLKGLAMRQGK